MRIAATPAIRSRHPSILPIPAEPGAVDLTLVLRSEWDPSYSHRFRQLRYVVVGTVDEATNLLRKIGYAQPQDASPDRN